MAGANRQHPLALAFAAKGLSQPQGMDPSDVNIAMKEAVGRVSQMAEAKLGAEVLRSALAPAPPVDPLDQVTKLANLAGLKNAEEDREEKRLTRERQERLDQERLEEQRRQSSQNQNIEMLKFMMQMSQSQSETTQKLILQMSQDNQKLIERMEQNSREMFNRMKEDKPKESELDQIMKRKMVESILNPPQPTDPIEELAQQKERLTQLGIVGQPSSTPDWQLEYQLKREELEMRREDRQAQLEIERMRAENQGKQIQSGFEAIMGILSQRKAEQSRPTQAPNTADIPMAECICDNCEHHWLVPYGVRSVICPNCKEQKEVQYPDDSH